MYCSRNHPAGKRKYLFGLTLLLFASLIGVAFSIKGNDDFDTARREVLLRKIGDELLLQSGDLTSRVLPVKKIAGNEYQIRFENDFTFLPDSLVNITRHLLAKDQLTGDYVVNVFNGSKSSVAYGFAISKSDKDDIIACLGRKQPKAPYTIDIKFKTADATTAKNAYLLRSLPFLALVSFVFFCPIKQRKATPGGQNTGILTLGSVLFNGPKRQLLINGNTIDLTVTETGILQILALSPNQTVERSRLQKEIWEDAGVIVGRSLDMFISKLRKKLDADTNVKIVVVRSKGYKLEICNQ